MDVETDGRPASVSLPTWWKMTLTRRTGLWLVLLVAILTHLPTHFTEFATDDYLIRAMVAGDTALFEAGFAKADPAKGFWQRLGDGFHFYHTEQGTRDFYQRYGNLPWWSSETARMNPWRPLSALTHWVDFQLAPESYAFQSFHSLLYVLLMAWAAYRLFWRIRPEPGLAVLATLLLVVDGSHLVNFAWIAARNVFIASALACIAFERFLAWREGQLWAFPVSLLAFVAALLGAENGLSILAYLGAFLLLIDRGSWLRKGLGLAPYLLLVVGWRAVYSYLGYGASGIGLYHDPGQDPLGFLESLIQVLPVILAGMITTADGMMVTLAPELRIWLVVGSALLLVLCLLFILPLLRRDKWVQVMLLGSVLAAVPASAHLYGSARSPAFASIGFFWVFALWLQHLAQVGGWRWQRFVLAGAVTLHLVLPGLFGFLTTSNLLPVVYVGDGRFSSIEAAMQQKHRPVLVLVNSPVPSREFYVPFEWRYRFNVVPGGVNVLAPGIVSMDLTRIGPRLFELSAPAGLPLNHQHQVNSVEGRHPNMSSAFSAQMLQGLISSADDSVQPGDERSAGNLRVTVLAMNEDRPSKLRIEMVGDTAPEDMVWQYYDWQKREYFSRSAPAVGETAHFPGPFDIKAKSLLNLCLGCEEGASRNE